jgi:hypothetical protein
LTIGANRAEKKLPEQSNLTEIADLRTTAAKELAIAESQLNGAVQGKLDALKRAIDLMEESTMKLAGFTDCMNSVETRIQKTSTAMVNYLHVRKVHHARENLSKVISQIEFFANVPERVAQLRTLLEEDPSRLKDVFLEALQLEAWRAALMTEIANSRSKKMSTTGRQQASPSRKTASGQVRSRVSSTIVEGYSDETFSRIQQVVSSHLGIIAELSRDVKNTMWGNIERLFDVASLAPSDLVASFEIIEMQQEYLDRRLAQVQRRAKAEGKEITDLASVGFEDVRYQASERLKRNLAQRIEARFIVNIETSKSNPDDGHKKYKSSAAFGEEISVHMVLTAGTDIMQLIIQFKNEVMQCIPPSYAPLHTCLSVFEDQFLPYMRDLTRDITKLDVSDCVQLIDWIDYFQAQMTMFEMSGRPTCIVFAQLSEDLMNEYLHRIKSQVMEWFGNIKKQQAEVVRSTEGILITSTPEDMFNVIHMQIAVAKDRLAREHLKDVVNANLQVYI